MTHFLDLVAVLVSDVDMYVSVDFLSQFHLRTAAQRTLYLSGLTRHAPVTQSQTHSRAAHSSVDFNGRLT